MNELIVKFYVNIASNVLLEELMGEINFKNRDKFEIDFIKNGEFNEEKAMNFPDGFLYFPFFIEYYKENSEIMDEDVTNSKMILEHLWQNKIPVVTCCDFENSLPEKGGYQSKNTPW
jgi:hypothetical protein